MSDPFEDRAYDPESWAQADSGVLEGAIPAASTDAEPRAATPLESAPVPSAAQPGSSQPPLDGAIQFPSWSQPEVKRPARIPNLGHVLLLVPLLGLGFVVAMILFFVGAHFHFFGVLTFEQAGIEIHYILGSEAAIYLVTFGLARLVFPLFWHESLFAGLQWNGEIARRLLWRLFGLAIFCFFLALLNGYLLPSPTNTPIEKAFKTPGAAWLLFGFGVTFAPFFEEMLFRGFLLPSLCTLADWTDESLFGRPHLGIDRRVRVVLSVLAMCVSCDAAIGTPAAVVFAIYRQWWALLICITLAVLGMFWLLLLLAVRPARADQFVRPVAGNGHPQWSLAAMIVGSMYTSVPFAAMHAEQTGYSIWPLFLLVGVSLVLCWVRLATRSLAASTLVHTGYNFMLFTWMLIGTGGFKHLDKM
jgi:hypothetical protein